MLRIGGLPAVEKEFNQSSTLLVAGPSNGLLLAWLSKDIFVNLTLGLYVPFSM